MAKSAGESKKSAGCAESVVDKKTGKKRKCKNKSSGRSKYCVSHKK